MNEIAGRKADKRKQKKEQQVRDTAIFATWVWLFVAVLIIKCVLPPEYVYGVEQVILVPTALFLI